ncbi:MAG TPA: PAS domain S-box protein [Terriglobia bacterium]|nr:PAS domain S-box protein [Terriglobia bacterium]
MMESSENLNEMPLNPDWNPEKARTFESPRRKAPWILIASFLFLTAAVTGLVWHDLRLAYTGALTHWKVLLTNSANDQVSLAAMWLRERQMNAEFIAENPSTAGLLTHAAQHGNNAEMQQNVDRDLKRITAVNGLLAGVVLDLQCQIVARGSTAGAGDSDFQPVCEKVYRDKKFHVIASGLGTGEVRLSIAVPVFTEAKLWPSGKKIHPIAGMVLLVTNPWKTLLPFFVPGGEPAKTLETALVWSRGKDLVVFYPARAARGEKSVIVQSLSGTTFEARAASRGDLAFGEFTDHRGVRILGVAKQITMAGDHLARMIDRDEALAEFHHRMALELLAGILLILLFGFLAAGVYRHTATEELIEKLHQQEALLALKKNVEISEQRYQALFENANDVILTLDLESRITSMNKSAELVSGFSREEAQGQSVLQIIAQEHHERIRQIVQDLLAGKKVPLHEVALNAKDGRHVLVEVNRQLIYKDGQPVGIQVIARDITERKRADKELQEEKAFSDAVMKSLPGAFYVIDRQGRLMRWNKGAESLGYSGQELTAMGPDALIAEEDRALIAAKREQAFAEGSSTAEAHIVARDGRKIPYLFSADRAVIGENVYVIGTGIDITERKQMVEALRHSEERYREFISHTAEGVWRLEFEQPIPVDIPEEEVFSRMRQFGYLAECNDALARILGMNSAADVVGARFNDLIPIADELWNERVRSLIRSGFVQRTLEFNFVDRMGNSKEVRRTEIPIVENGMLMRTWGITRDITERKQMREALRASEQRYRDFIAHSQEGLWRIEFEPPIPVGLPEKEVAARMYSTGYLAECNEAQARLAGWNNVAEKIGAPLRDLTLPADPEGVDRVLSMIRSGFKPRGIEFHYEDRQGVHRDVFRTEVPVIENGLLKRTWGITHDITERKRAEEALRESEERFRQMAVHSPFAFLLWDVRERRHAYVSPAYETIWGLTPESLYLDVDGWKKAVHPDDRARMERRVLGDFQSHPEKEGIEDEFRIVRPDGSIRWVQMHRFPVRNEVGDVYRIGLIAQDVSERKHAEEALRESEVRYRTLVDDSLALICTHALDGTLLSVNPAAAAIWGGSPEELAGKNIQEFLTPSDRKFYGEYIERIRTHNLDSGVMQVLSKAGEKRSWLYRNILRHEAGKEPFVLGFAQDITERKQAEEALRESEERFRQMAENSPYMFWLFDVKTEKLLYVSPAYEKIWKRKVEDLYASPRIWRDSLHPDDRERVTADFDARARAEGSESEFRIVLPDGSVRWLHGRTFPLRDASDQVQRLAGIAYDVTERKHADLALKASEASLAEAQRIGQMGSWEWNARTDEAVWSDELYRLYGLAPGAMSPTGDTFINLVHPEDREGIYLASEKANQDEQTLRVGFRVTRTDGEVRYFQTRAEVVRDSAGNTLRMIGTNQDVTERVRADEALRQREKELEEAQRLAKVGSWAMDIQSRALTLSDELYRILGLDRNGSVPDIETIARCFAPETWAQIQIAGGKTTETGQPFEVEGALNLPGGRKKWVLTHGEIERDRNGNPVRYRGTAQDITERKEVEEALRSSQEMFFKAFHSSPEPISIMTLGDGRFIDVNKAFSHQLGYDRAEVIGHTVDELGLQPLAGLTTEQVQLWEQGALRDLELELFTKFGEVRTAIVSFETVEIGGVLCILAQGRDITEHRRAEKALRISDLRYRDFISHSHEGVWRIELELPIPVEMPAEEATERMLQFGIFAECNDAMARIYGFSRSEELVGKRLGEIIPRTDTLRLESARAAARAGWKNRQVQMQASDAAGNTKTFLRTEVPIVENGRVVRIWGITRDVTELTEAENALRKSEASLAEAQRIARMGSWEWDVLTNQEQWSDEMFRLLGMEPGKVEPSLEAFLNFVHPDDREGLILAGEKAQLEQHSLQYEYRAIRTDGIMRIFRSRAEIVRDAEGNPVRMVGATQDVTEHRQAEEALRVSEARYKTLIEGAPEAIVVADMDTQKFIDFNENAMHLFGLSREDLLKVGPVDVSPPAQPDGQSSRDGALDYLRQVLAGESPVFEWVYRSAYGNEIPCEVRLVRLPAAGRNLVRGSITDITERKQAEEERSRLVSIVESSGDAIVGASPEGFITDWNAAAERVYGYTAEEIHGKHVSILAPSSGANEIPVFLEKINQGERISDFEAVSLRKDGTEFPVSITMSPIRDSQGGILGLSGIIRDITSRKRLEEQVTLSQKMESVGRLAGGVAHDFNNMLQIIHGYSELVLDELSQNDSSRGHVQEIKNVVERAAGLTRQLLAFGRQQVLSPQVMDLNVAITHLSKMLRRLIGEDINLEILEAKNLGRVRADPGQIDQVIMNLAVNARDAMPKGGKLTIETANVLVDNTFALGHFPMAPGNYVMVSVCDSGIGMDAQTQARIFEPFFTTKEKGKGTGLGLATVYGIVKQSGGYIWVQSELGRGSAFRVYLPPVKDAATIKEVKEVRPLKGGTETVLLVEDEENVRLLVRRALQAKGYTVLEAQNGKDALRVARQHQGPIHLLMTDVVMPGMGGRELSERLIRLRGEMKTLYMSGYANDAIHHHGTLNPGTELLQKPFSADVLATKVREVLKSV